MRVVAIPFLITTNKKNGRARKVAPHYARLEAQYLATIVEIFLEELFLCGASLMVSMKQLNIF